MILVTGGTGGTGQFVVEDLMRRRPVPARVRLPRPRTHCAVLPAVATISNASGEWGRVTAVAPGQVTISATYDGLTASTTLDVQ